MINQRKPNPFVHAIRAKYFSPALVYAACSAGLLMSAPVSAQEADGPAGGTGQGGPPPPEEGRHGEELGRVQARSCRRFAA